MRKDFIALIMIGIVLGLGGGYGLGYMRYQPQIKILQSSNENLQILLSELNTKIEAINNTLESYQLAIRQEFYSSKEEIESSIRTIKDELNDTKDAFIDINSKLNDISNKSWHIACEMEGPFISSGAGDLSETFQVRGNTIRLRWYIYGGAIIAPGGYDFASVEIPWIQIIIMNADGTSYTDRGSTGVYASDSCDIEIPPGEYYLKIRGHGVTDGLVVVWDYY